MASPETSIDGGFRAWHFFVLASLLAASAAVVFSEHPRSAALILTSLTVATAGLAGYGCYRMLAPLAFGEPPPTAESLGARARAELAREKAGVLRSIKELEFDRAMSKVSDEDFEEMAARLRARAIGLMKQLDESGAGYRQVIEQELRARVARAEPRSVILPESVPEGPTTATIGHGSAQGAAACPDCGTANDDDAKFCKHCGRQLGGARREGRTG
jgi:hypothetical protein